MVRSLDHYKNTISDIWQTRIDNLITLAKIQLQMLSPPSTPSPLKVSSGASGGDSFCAVQESRFLHAINFILCRNVLLRYSSNLIGRDYLKTLLGQSLLLLHLKLIT